MVDTQRRAVGGVHVDPAGGASAPADADTAAGRKAILREALTALIANLVDELHADAERVIANAQRSADAVLAERDAVLAKSVERATVAEAALQRTRASLQERSDECTKLAKQLEDHTLAAAKTDEQLRGLEARLADQQRHTESLEREGERAQEAFHQFQATTKDHQEQASRGQLQQLEELRKTLEQANESLKTKSQELIAADRDNARLAQQLDDLDRRCRDLERDRQRLQAELKDHQVLLRERVKLRADLERMTREREHIEHESTATRAQAGKDRIARQSAELALARAQARAQTLEIVVAELRVGATTNSKAARGAA